MDLKIRRTSAEQLGVIVNRRVWARGLQLILILPGFSAARTQFALQNFMLTLLKPLRYDERLFAVTSLQTVLSRHDGDAVEQYPYFLT